MLRQKQHRLGPGPWPARSGRKRVLIENGDRAVRWAYAGILGEAGYDVESCGGPGDGDGEPVRCPLLEERRCLLVDGADVVVSTCDLAESRAILARLTSNGGPAVVFEAPEATFDRFRDVAGKSIALPVPVTGASLRAAVADAEASV